MATGYSHVPFSFVARWIRWVRDNSGTTRIHEIDFSEGLLKTLYYETDIGSIPRGAYTADTPKYTNNPNWNKRISGCYWCLRDRTHVQGICCSKECIYYLHEWCVERVELFQKRRFCKRPGCDKSPTQQDYNCCCLTHHKEYSELYNWIGKGQLNGLIAKGPGWYNKELSFSSDTQLTQTNPFTSTNSHISDLTQTNPFTSSALISDSTTMDLATELKTSLVFYTDVGPIPRSYKKGDHSVSQHSNSINWRADITGCYQCGRPVTERDEYLCSEKCCLIFNEWCRLKVVDAIKTKFCDYPGCGKQPIGGYSTCSKEHFEKRNTYLDSNEYYKSVQKGPHWYRGTHSSSSSDMSTTTHQSRTPSCHDNPVNPSNPSHPYIVTHLFSRTLTEWMYKESDIGPIPRSLLQIDYIGDKNKPTASNWNAIIPHCYWCCAGSTLHVQGIACSEQCFFLFNEWCHRKYNKATFKQLCKFLHCGNSLSSKKDCCYEHTSKYSSYTQRFGNQLKSSDFALGPKWYSNKSVKHIDFYNREDPFYEFTNFFPCSKLFIDGKVWKTTEHYFQAQKFTGTPHVECVRIMSTPRETFEYTRRSSVQKWVRPDWAVVKERIMLKALEAKFNQNEYLAQLLIRTGDMQLYEHTRNDKFWGDGGDRKGENKLGKLLMQVRFDMQGRCPFLPSRLDHILLTSHPLPHAPNISSSPGSNLCTPRAGEPQGGGAGAHGGKHPICVPYGASPHPINVHVSPQTSHVQKPSPLKPISNSDTDDTISSNGTSDIPISAPVLYSNYGDLDTQNSFYPHNTIPITGSFSDRTPSLIGNHSGTYNQVNYRCNSRTPDLTGNVFNKISGYESKSRNDVGTSLPINTVNNHPMYPVRKSGLPTSTSSDATSTSLPILPHMTLKMNSTDPTI